MSSRKQWEEMYRKELQNNVALASQRHLISFYILDVARGRIDPTGVPAVIEAIWVLLGHDVRTLRPTKWMDDPKEVPCRTE